MKNYLRAVCDHLELLSSNASAQEAYLKKLGVYPSIDELVLEFDDLALLADSQFRSGEISAQVLASIKALELKFTSFNTNEKKDLWTPHALYTSPHWAEVRDLASSVLVMTKAKK